MVKSTKPTIFDHGTLAATPGVMGLLAAKEGLDTDLLDRVDRVMREALFRKNLLPYLTRHITGDWGEEICDEDAQSNLEAVSAGLRILSAYRFTDPKQTKFWIITEADRSVTTFLLPEEYQASSRRVEVYPPGAKPEEVK